MTKNYLKELYKRLEDPNEMRAYIDQASKWPKEYILALGDCLISLSEQIHNLREQIKEKKIDEDARENE